MRNENLSVFVIVRETEENKEALVNLAEDRGFSQLSDFLRSEWRKWIV